MKLTFEQYESHFRGLFKVIRSTQYTEAVTHRVWDAYEEQGIKKPDNFEDIVYGQQPFRTLFDDVVVFCREHYGLKGSQPVLLTGLTQEVTAYTLRTMDDRIVVVLDEFFHLLINTLCTTSLMRVYTKPTDDDALFLYKFSLNTLQTFFGSRTFSRDGDAYMKIIARDYEVAKWASYVELAIIVFIYCHEIAHQILGHTAERRYFAVLSSAGEHQVAYDHYSIKKEYEADAMGYEMFLSIVQDHRSLSYGAAHPAIDRMPLVFFELLELINYYKKHQLTYEISETTHPLPEKRKAALAQYESKCSDEGMEFHQAMTMGLRYFLLKMSEINRLAI